MVLACCHNDHAEQEFPQVNVLLAKVLRKGCFHLSFEGFPVSLEDVGESSFGSLLEDCGCLKFDQDRQVVGVQRCLGPQACRNEELMGGQKYVRKSGLRVAGEACGGVCIEDAEVGVGNFCRQRDPSGVQDA